MCLIGRLCAEILHWPANHRSHSVVTTVGGRVALDRHMCLPRYRTEDSTHASGNFRFEIVGRRKDVAVARPRDGLDWGGTATKQVGRVAHNDSRLSQMKHQLDATLCRFYFCRVTLHVSGASAHHQEYLKLVQWPLVHVLSLQVSHHITLLGPEGPNKVM